MKAVVDSSVVVKWFVKEKDAEASLDLRFLPLAAPDLLLVECANVFWKKVRKDEYAADDAVMAIRALERARISLSPSHGLAGRAFEIGRALDHGVYDCFYLALAERLGLPLITADAKLATKATPDLTSVRVLGLSNWKTVLNAD